MSNTNLNSVITKKAPYVEEQLSEHQKIMLKSLIKNNLSNVRKFTMTTYLNVIITYTNGDKVQQGHWFLFTFKVLLPLVVGKNSNDMIAVMLRIQHGENIIDVLTQYENTLLNNV